MFASWFWSWFHDHDTQAGRATKQQKLASKHTEQHFYIHNAGCTNTDVKHLMYNNHNVAAFYIHPEPNFKNAPQNYFLLVLMDMYH